MSYSIVHRTTNKLTRAVLLARHGFDGKALGTFVSAAAATIYAAEACIQAFGATPRPLLCNGWGWQGQDCAFLVCMRLSDTAFRVRMLAALMQLCTIVVREVGLGRSRDLLVDPHDMLFSWHWASASELLAVECTCKHEL